MQTQADPHLLFPLAPAPRQSSERAGQLEATLNSCRRRLGELRELRRQVRQLEECNAGHAERTRQLEEELRRAGSLRAQLEAQRRQVRVGAWTRTRVGAPLGWLLTLAYPQQRAEPFHPERAPSFR